MKMLVSSRKFNHPVCIFFPPSLAPLNIFFILQVEIRPMMYLALTYDHRLIDGREAVLFLRKVKSGVEDPTSILAGI